MITNINFKNYGKMSDCDGPAYVVYSNIGYNKAQYDVYFDEVKLSTKRKDNNMHINAYAFLGIDIHNENNEWINCCDAGLVCGQDGTWHIFYNVFDTFEGQDFWYESNINLKGNGNYRLILDSSNKDDEATISVYDLNTLELLDSKTFKTKGSKKSGINTSYLQNYALDFPDDIKFGLEDWTLIVLKNTNHNLYMKNLKIKNAKLNDKIWDENKTCNRSIWPDMEIKNINYETVKIDLKKLDYETIINLDMNE